MAAPDFPFPLQKSDISFGEDVFYRLLDDLFTEGIIGANDLRVQQRGTPAMAVTVDPGEGYIGFESPSYGGTRRVRQSVLTDSGTVGAPNTSDNWTTTFNSADGSNPRIDRVIARVRDHLLDASGLYRMEFAVIAGTPTSGANLTNLTGAAAVPVNSLLLANVLIPAGATTVITANIDTTVRTVAKIGNRLAINLQGVPSGSMTEFGGTAAPSGWLICDGSAISRTTFAALFAAISTNYGTGDGSTTFNIPDYRGRVAVGYAPTGGHADVATIGNSDGLAVANRRAKHRHTLNWSDPGHAHTTNVANTQGSGLSGPGGGVRGDTGSNYGSDTVGTGISASVGPQTGAEPTDTPAYLVASKIIKT